MNMFGAMQIAVHGYVREGNPRDFYDGLLIFAAHR
jgi:hypothetical protein